MQLFTTLNKDKQNDILGKNLKSIHLNYLIILKIKELKVMIELLGFYLMFLKQ